MRKVHVISVPSSATRFVAQRVLAPWAARADGAVRTYHIGTGDNKLEDSHVRDAMAEGAVIVPVRDPMLVLISNTNRGRDVNLLSLLMMVRLVNEGAYPFRVDPAPDGRQDGLYRLDDYLRYEGVEGAVDLSCGWEVEADWVMEDRTGLRDAYDRRLSRPQLHAFCAQLNHCEPVAEFYQGLGYGLHPSNENLAAAPEVRY